MLKFFGSLLTVGASSLIGLMMAQRYYQRPSQLRLLQSNLQMLGTEIIYAATPLPEAMMRIARSDKSPIKNIFSAAAEAILKRDGITASEAWLLALENSANITCLAQSDLEILKSFGASLGVSDRDDQQKHLNLAIEQLKKEELKALEEEKKNAKMWQYLGVLSGLAIVLVIY